jgi:acyl dehydratase
MTDVMAALQPLVGTELGVSAWVTVDQDMIDRFADVTGDHQWIHVDRARAAAGPFGGTIAHGFLTLSLLPSLNTRDWSSMDGVLGALNYGLDKVRFLTPVRSGARIRNRVKMLSAEQRGPGRVLVANESTVEIENETKSALVAETLVLLIS